MGQILHGRARTTAAIRRAIQHSQESLMALSKRYSINPKTVAYYIDWQAMARDAEMSGDLFTIETAFESVHVFAGC